jgi:hypothetical protein
MKANCDGQDLRASFAATLRLFLHAGSYENSAASGDAGCFYGFYQGFCSRATEEGGRNKIPCTSRNRLTIFQMRKRDILYALMTAVLRAYGINTVLRNEDCAVIFHGTS